MKGGYTTTLEWRLASEQTYKWRCGIGGSGLDFGDVRDGLVLFAIKVSRKWNGTGQRAGFIRWCLQRQIIGLLQRERARKRLMKLYRPRDAILTEDDPAPAIELRESIALAMASLSPRRRMIVTLWLANRPLDEIIARMGVTRQRIFQQLRRSFELMRPYFE